MSIKVNLWHDFCSDNVSIAILNDTPQGTFIGRVNKDYGFLDWEELPPYEHCSHPTLVLPRTLSKEILKKLAEALDKQGVKTEHDHKIQGTLDAQSKHLEDMRRIVFEEDTPK